MFFVEKKRKKDKLENIQMEIWGIVWSFSNKTRKNISTDILNTVDLFLVQLWRAVPTDRSLDSGSGLSSRGGSTPGLGTKNIHGMLYVSQQHEGDPQSAVLSLKYGGLLIKSAASRYQTPNSQPNIFDKCALNKFCWRFGVMAYVPYNLHYWTLIEFSRPVVAL